MGGAGDAQFSAGLQHVRRQAVAFQLGVAVAFTAPLGHATIGIGGADMHIGMRVTLFKLGNDAGDVDFLAGVVVRCKTVMGMGDVGNQQCAGQCGKL